MNNLLESLWHVAPRTAVVCLLLVVLDEKSKSERPPAHLQAVAPWLLHSHWASLFILPPHVVLELIESDAGDEAHPPRSLHCEEGALQLNDRRGDGEGAE